MTLADELVRAAKRVSDEVGHTMQCRFTACTCGQTAKFADALIDLRIVLRKLKVIP